jgi:branched-chain amino acid transport system permease protein
MLGGINPEFFRFQVSIFLLIIVVLSGLGSVYGVLIGGLIISMFDGVFLAQVLPPVFPDIDIQQLRWVFFGAGLIIIMVFRPQGLFPTALNRRTTIIPGTTLDIAVPPEHPVAAADANPQAKGMEQ